MKKLQLLVITIFTLLMGGVVANAQDPVLLAEVSSTTCNSITLSISQNLFGVDFINVDISDSASAQIGTTSAGGGDFNPGPANLIVNLNRNLVTGETLTIEIFANGGLERLVNYIVTITGCGTAQSSIPFLAPIPKPKGYVCSTPEAIVFMDEEAGISIYRIDPANPQITLLTVRVTIDELEGLIAQPSEHVTIETVGGWYFTGFYQLLYSERQYQVNLGPDSEGKMLTCIWNGYSNQGVREIKWNITDVFKQFERGEIPTSSN
jgi:hypothetical protein